jgi:exodeoxyribonuclease V alpha subunit
MAEQDSTRRAGGGELESEQMISEVTQPAIWSKAMPLPRASGRRGVGPAWGELRALRGVVERIVYQALDDGYVVGRVTLDGGEDGRPDEAIGADGFVTIAGTMPDLVVGEAIEARGWWRKEARHGWTFRVVDYRTTLPATVHGIRRYLASGLVHGIGPVIAGRIVDLFGGDTLATIDGDPERLREVPGVGPVRAERVAAAWAEHRQVHEVMVALQSYGVSTALAARIYRKYKQNSVRIMTDDPFRLAREVVGIGFKTADKIARSIGVAPNAPARVRSAVVHALRELALRGDTQVDEAKLATHARLLLGAEEVPVEEAIGDLIGERQIVQAGELVADARLAAAEAAIADRLLTLRDREGKTLLGHASAQRAWDAAFAGPETRLTDEQDLAIATALTRPVSIITGGPGTGKTFALRAILEAAEGVGARVLLAAPTGRAAQRMKEATGRDARTIHRLLELRPGGSGWRGAGNVLPADCVVVDEASMVDVPLMHRMVRAIAPGAHLVLVGDPDQLPSVGPGNVLADLIASGRFPVTKLTHVFRHGAGSGIALAAREVNRGRIPPPRAATGDYFFVSRADPEAAADTIVKLVAERIPARLGCSASEVQVLAPMHRGAVGVGALNARLQAALNPRRDGASELRANGRVFREGDRVMQLRNDYTRNVFNGDMGLVERVNTEEGNLAIRFEDGRLATYAAGDLWMLTHSFAVSVHKGQGAEFRAVVLVAMTTHALALNRTLLYTALTRARELAVVVGQEKAFEMGVDNWRWSDRVTALGHLLGEAKASAEEADGPPDDEEAWEPYYVAEDEDAVWDVLARAQPRA